MCSSDLRCISQRIVLGIMSAKFRIIVVANPSGEIHLRRHIPSPLGVQRMIGKIDPAVVLLRIIHVIQAVLRIFIAQENMMRVAELPRKIIVDIRGLNVIDALGVIGTPIIISNIIVILKALKRIGQAVIEPIGPVYAEFSVIPPPQALRQRKEIRFRVAPRIV